MASIESNFQGMSTAYVGMTSAEGMCEAVEVVGLPAASRAEEQEIPTDRYILAGTMGRPSEQNSDNCVSSVVRAVAFTMVRTGQSIAVAQGIRLLLNEGDVKDTATITLMKIAGIELLGLTVDVLWQLIAKFSHDIPLDTRWPSFSYLWERVRNDCGGPMPWRNPFRLPEWGRRKEKGKERVPPPERVSQPSPKPHMEPWLLPRPLIDFQFDLPDLSPEAIRNAAMAAATVIVIGGMILLAPVGI